MCCAASADPVHPAEGSLPDALSSPLGSDEYYHREFWAQTAPFRSVTAVMLVFACFGALIGSFLNVVLWRVPRGESIVSPGSHCPHCETPLRPYELIPIVSWVALRGRCRTCHEPIAFRYPLVELVTAVVFAVVALLLF
jgi:hypothetical protein